MLVMRKRLEVSVMRCIVISENDFVTFVHILVAVFYFREDFGISYFNKIQDVTILKYN